MLCYKSFLHASIKYNLWHYGLKGSELFCKKIGIAPTYIDYRKIVSIGYKEFGLLRLIFINLTLLALLFPLFVSFDVLNCYLNNAFLTITLSTMGFVLSLKKFSLLTKLNLSKCVAILFLLITYFFNFYWSISLLFLCIYENILGFKGDVNYDYLR